MINVAAAAVLGREPMNVIDEHGRESYPNECCGALLGRTGNGCWMLKAFPLPNRTDEGQRRRFLVTSDDYLKAERRASELGLELVGFYHSHPDHPARPSEYDLAHAWPNLFYVIVSVQEGVATDVRCWRLDEDRSRFVETGIGVASDGGLEGC